MPEGSGGHVCLSAGGSAEAVDAFYRTALSAGAHSDGAPGLRPEYRDTYYAAFILDPDGNCIEAVTFGKDHNNFLCCQQLLQRCARRVIVARQ